MEFCPNCGSMLVLKKTETAASMACPKCEYVKEASTKRSVRRLAVKS